MPEHAVGTPLAASPGGADVDIRTVGRCGGVLAGKLGCRAIAYRSRSNVCRDWSPALRDCIARGLAEKVMHFQTPSEFARHWPGELRWKLLRLIEHRGRGQYAAPDNAESLLACR
jgi:hypothetical protein